MGKYRLVRMNEVQYTDSESKLSKLLDAGYVLEPVFADVESTETVEPTEPVEAVEPVEEKPKRTRKKAADDKVADTDE